MVATLKNFDRPDTMLKLVCLVGVIGTVVNAGYVLNPAKCASKISGDNCFLEGTLMSQTRENHETSMKGTCVQCLIQRPGVETWGCSLGELREYCKLGFEEAPADVDEEERQNSKTFQPINKFTSSHVSEMNSLKTKLHTGIADFAALLSKFDEKNPDFTNTEQKIMQKLLYQGDSIQKIFWSDGGLSSEEKKKYMTGTENFRKDFLTSPQYSEDIRPQMGNSFKKIIVGRESRRAKLDRVKESADVFKPNDGR